MSIRPAVAIVIALMAAPTGAAGQTPDAPAGSPAPAAAGFDGGFFIQSGKGDTRLTFGLVAQTDGRFSIADAAGIVDTFTLRKVRPTFTGRAARAFDFKIMPDLAGGKAVVQDAYLGIRFSPAFRLRVGKDKTPVGYELLQSDAYLLFPERSLASSLVPNRDVGVAAMGEFGGGRASYTAGVYNGVPDGTSSSTEIDTNDGKDVAGRVVVRPFTRRRIAGPLSGLGLHVGASIGRQSADLPAFRTSVQQTFFSYAAGVRARGPRTRIAPAVFYYFSSIGAFAEYVRSTQRIAGPDSVADVTHSAWNATASWLVTGERASEGMLRPAHDFAPGSGRWGALQLVARYSGLTADPTTFDRGLAASDGSRAARQLTAGVNWYPTPFIKFYGTYERTTFRGAAARRAEHVILFRSQLAFGDAR